MSESALNKSAMNKLILTDFPFHQNALIEASAGTGKTYTISNLYLRLLLGHRCQVKTVSQILVLTFTNAATAELKERILSVIRKALRNFALGQSDDAFISQLLNEVKDKEQACQRLLIAVQEMDLASVFTIHGFCQRVLTEYAFESGASWQEALLLDESEYLLSASTDYWRTHVATLSIVDAQWVTGYWRSPDALAKQMRSVVYRDIGEQAPEELYQALTAASEQYQQLHSKVRNWWAKNDMSAVLADAALKANVKIAKAPFLESMRQFAHGDIAEPDLGKDGWLTLAPEKITKARKKSSKPIDEAQFELFVELAALQERVNKLKQEYYFWHALEFIRAHLSRNKQLLAELSPDDLLVRLQNALRVNQSEEGDLAGHAANREDSKVQKSPLATLLLEKYPIAMVDEFQDTDPTQFAIFQSIYGPPVEYVQRPPSDTALIMIGDPKQAIYSFRGGDIYTYLLARNFVSPQARYTLAQNWRSQPELVAVTNRFFAASEHGFMDKDMPFFEVSAGKSQKNITLQNQPLSAVSCRVLIPDEDNKPIKWDKASADIASLCAAAVYTYLNGFKVENTGIKAGDVCILVRDRFEADIIKTALLDHNIDSVFLLKDTVFKSSVTYSLLLLLNAINDCRSESRIKAALLDDVFCYSHDELASLNQDVTKWQDILEIFIRANELWLYKGIMASVEFVFREFSLYQRIKNQKAQYQRTLTDVRHLCEILQFQSRRIEGRTALIAWYTERVARPELLASDGMDDTQWRLETDQNLVQICTIHGSKGLQYPLVFIPFLSRYKDAKTGFYHDEDHALRYNITQDESHGQMQEKERLAEDIRLLYVALTRAELHCWLGVWDNNVAGRSVASGFAKTAFGKVLDASEDAMKSQGISGEQFILSALQTRFAELSADIQFADPEEYTFAEEARLEYQGTETASADFLKDLPELYVNSLNVPVHHAWRMSSYSAISRTRFLPDTPELTHEEQKASDEITGLNSTADEPDLQAYEDYMLWDAMLPEEALTAEPEMRFSFARGASPGSYLHEVLEHSDFLDAQSVRDNALDLADKFKIDKKQVPDIVHWLMESLSAPLFIPEVLMDEDQNSYCLAEIEPHQKIAEMEFYLPLYQVNIMEFNRLIRDWLPDFTGHYQVQQLNGMLKGYLDLVYLRNGQLFVADYKSNHLGDTLQDYGPQALHDVMLHHDYYLQALLYSLAMHRFLRNKLHHYDYQQHMGGAQYLFLRGMTPQYPGNGVLTVKPPQSLIEQLDALFSGLEQSRLTEETEHVR